MKWSNAAIPWAEGAEGAKGEVLAKELLPHHLELGSTTQGHL